MKIKYGAMHNIKLTSAPNPSEHKEGPIDPATIETSTDTATEVGKACEEIGGPSGPEPTRYGDWERKGRCIDF